MKLFRIKVSIFNYRLEVYMNSDNTTEKLGLNINGSIS